MQAVRGFAACANETEPIGRPSVFMTDFLPSESSRRLDPISNEPESHRIGGSSRVFQTPSRFHLD